MSGAVLGFAPDWLTVSVAGLVVGAVTMLLFQRLSPQETLRAMKVEARDARRAMQSYDGEDFWQMWALTRRSLALQFQQLRVMFVPTMIAALPVIITMGAFELIFEGVEVLDVGPSWLWTWHATFLIALSVAAIVTKVAFRIE